MQPNDQQKSHFLDVKQKVGICCQTIEKHPQQSVKISQNKTQTL